MLRHWKKLLIIFFVAILIYGGCSTDGMLKAEKFFREDNPKLGMSPKMCYMLATSAFRTFRYQLAIEIIDRNLKDFPYDRGAVNAEFRRAVAYEKLGQYDTAISLYETFLADHPKDNRYQSIMGKVAKLKALHQEI